MKSLLSKPKLERKKISVQLLKSIYIWYFSIALTVTLIQIIYEIQNNKKILMNELVGLEKSFKKPLGTALFSEDEEIIDQIIVGILKFPSLAGVIIEDDLDVTKSYIKDGDGRFKKSTDQIRFNRKNYYSHYFGIAVKGTFVGTVEFLTKKTNLWERTQIGILIITINALIKAICLWIIIVFLIDKILGRPISNFTEEIKNFDLDKLSPLKLKLKGNNELSELKETYNSLTERLIEVTKIAREKNKAKSDFLSHMSHEIRTPLNSIIGFSELGHQSAKDDNVKSYLKSVISSGKFLLKIINDILDLSKIEAQKLDLEIDKVNLAEMVDELLTFYVHKAEENGLSFEIDIDNSIPEIVYLDEGRLKQVILNLISNAFKFTEKGVIRLQFKNVRLDDSLTLEIKIKDTGRGIPEDQVKTVFNSYEQTKKQSYKKFGGTGLGLFIVRKIIEVMGGEIAMKSVLYQGTTVTILLPKVRYDIKRKEQVQSDSVKGASSDRSDFVFKGQKVLLIDDIKNNRQLIIEHFKKKDLDFIEAQNGQEGLAYIEKDRPSLIVLEVKIPILDGISILEELKKSEDLRKTPVIVLTACAMKEDVARISPLCDCFLTKPLEKEELIKGFKKFLEFEVVELESPNPEAKTFHEVYKFNSDFYKEVIKQLNNGYRERFNSLSDNLVVDEIMEVNEEVMSLGEKYQCSLLLDWTHELKLNIESFDIDEIEVKLKNFDGLIRELEKYLEEKS